MKKFYFLLVAMLLGAYTASAWTVKFDASANSNSSGWTAVNVWAWDSSNNYTGGTWPGKAMTKGSDGLWTYTGEGTPTNIIFSKGAGSGTNQTTDLTFQDGATYSFTGVIGGKTYDYVVYFDNTNNWKEVYAYSWNPNLTGDYPGTKLTKNAEGLYVWTITTDSPTAPNPQGFQFNDNKTTNGNELKTPDISPLEVGATYLPNGTKKGEDSNEWNGWWVNLNIVGGEDNGVQLTNASPVASWSNVALGQNQFFVKIWDGSSDKYFGTGGAVVAGQAVTLSQDGGDMTVKGASADAVFNASYDVTTNELTLTLVSGSIDDDDDPVIPTVKDLELIGSFNNWEDAGTIPMTYNEESKEYTATVASWDGGTQFKIREVGTWSYTFGGDAGGEDVPSVLAVVGDNTVWENSSVNLEVPSTGWTNMSFVFTYEGNQGTLKISASSMVEDVTVDNNVAPVYYNLQGVRVDNPTNGLYIVVRGNEVSKQVIR